MEWATLKKINRPRPILGSCTVKAMGRYKIKFTPQFSVTPKPNTIKIRFTVRQETCGRTHCACSMHSVQTVFHVIACFRIPFYSQWPWKKKGMQTWERRGRKTNSVERHNSEDFTATSINSYILKHSSG